MPVGFPDYYGGLTLPVTVAEGGTGQTSFTAHSVLIGQGTSGLTASNVGTAGQVLQIPAGGGDPVFADLGSVSLSPPVTIAPYQQDALLVGSSGDLPSARGAVEIAAPSGSSVNPLIVSIGGTQLLNLSPAGNLVLAGGVTLGTPLPTASGGTGTSAPALVAGTGISITGSWPDNTITNSSNYASLAVPLPVASGGTGTSAPALVAGSNISITGSWPDQTIALSATPAVTSLSAGPTTAYATIAVYTAAGAANPAVVELLVTGMSNTERGGFTAAPSADWDFTGEGQGDVYLWANSALWLGYQATWALKIASGGIVSLSTPLAVGSGGTGATSLAAAGILSRSHATTLTDQTTTQTDTASIASTGTWLIVAHYRVHSAAGASFTLGVKLNYTAESGAVTFDLPSLSASGVPGEFWKDEVTSIYSVGGNSVSITATPTGLAVNDYYDLRVDWYLLE